MTTTIGAYTVTERLSGGGEIYLATSADGRRCVVRLFEVAPDDERVERVRSETLACAALAHPAVGVVTDVFDAGDKTGIVCPEPDEGTTLAELIMRLRQIGQTLEPAAAWHLGHQLAAALALAHSSEVEGDVMAICHGHLSPEHVAISWDGGVRLEGLGLSPLVGVPGLEPKPGYAAPEELGGGRITPRGDIYSLGAVLWELLAGRDVHAEMSVDELVGVPPSFHDAFARCLEPKLAKRRITSMEVEQFLDELRGGDQGKKLLVEALGVLRRGSTLLGPAPVERGPEKPPQLGRVTDRPGAPATNKAMPPLRPRQATLVGGGRAADALDWGAAAESASKQSHPTLPEIHDELSWGGNEEETTRFMPRPMFDDESEPGAGAKIGGVETGAKTGEESTLVTARSKLEEEIAEEGSEDVTMLRGREQFAELRAVIEAAKADLAAGRSPRPAAGVKPAEKPGAVAKPAAAEKSGAAVKPAAAAKPAAEMPAAAEKPAAAGKPAADVKSAAAAKLAGEATPAGEQKPAGESKPATAAAGTPAPPRAASSRRALSRPGFTTPAPGKAEPAPATQASAPADKDDKSDRVERAEAPRAPTPRSGPIDSTPDVEIHVPSSASMGTIRMPGMTDVEPESLHALAPSSQAPNQGFGSQQSGSQRSGEPPISLVKTLASEAPPPVDAPAPTPVKTLASIEAVDAPADPVAADDAAALAGTPRTPGPASAAKADAAPAAKPPSQPERAESADVPRDRPAATAAVPQTSVPQTSVPQTSVGGAPAGDGGAQDVSAPSPWSPEGAEAPAASARTDKPISVTWSIVLTVLTAVVVMVVGVWWVRNNSTVSAPSSVPTTDASGAGPAASTPEPDPSPSPSSSAPAPVPEAAPSTAPSGSAGPAPSSSGDGALAPSGEIDASKLPPTMGYLLVKFDGPPDADVVVFGKAVGKVNVPNEVQCRRTYVRVRAADGALWISEGKPVAVPCQGVATLELTKSK